jgi:hypothetical protein
VIEGGNVLNSFSYSTRVRASTADSCNIRYRYITNGNPGQKKHVTIAVAPKRGQWSKELGGRRGSQVVDSEHEGREKGCTNSAELEITVNRCRSAAASQWQIWLKFFSRRHLILFTTNGLPSPSSSGISRLEAHSIGIT